MMRPGPTMLFFWGGRRLVLDEAVASMKLDGAAVDGAGGGKDLPEGLRVLEVRGKRRPCRVSGTLEGLPETLERLILHNAHRLAGTLKGLAELENIEALDLHGCRGLSGSLGALKRLQSLERLDLSGSRSRCLVFSTLASS